MLWREPGRGKIPRDYRRMWFGSLCCSQTEKWGRPGSNRDSARAEAVEVHRVYQFRHGPPRPLLHIPEHLGELTAPRRSPTRGFVTDPYSISVAIPAFNEGQRLPHFLRDLTRIGAAVRHLRVEFVVVDDGSAPEHSGRYAAAVAEADRDLHEAGARHRVRLVAQPSNQGKGAAIRRGWAEAHRESGWLGFVDADGAVGAPEVWRLITTLEPDAPFDLLCGSRILMAGQRIERSAFRHFQGRIFATMAERTLRLGFYDTQCGFKLARADLLRRVLPSLQERSWLLDLELIALLQRMGARCREMPIDWADAGHSKVRFGVDAVQMALGLWRMRRRIAAVRPNLAVVPTADQGVPETRAAAGVRRR